MKYLVQKIKGKLHGKRGHKIVIRAPPDYKRSKSLTVHGYTMEEIHRMIYFLFYNDSFEENEKIRGFLTWKSKVDYRQQRKESQERTLKGWRKTLKF